MTNVAAVVAAVPTLDLASKVLPLARLKHELGRLEADARAAAKKRLAGTRLEKMLDKLPGTLESEFDALLDKVGLVRRSRLEIVQAPAEAVGATDVAAAAASDPSAVATVADPAVPEAAEAPEVIDEVGSRRRGEKKRA